MPQGRRRLGLVGGGGRAAAVNRIKFRPSRAQCQAVVFGTLRPSVRARGVGVAVEVSYNRAVDVQRQQGVYGMAGKGLVQVTSRYSIDETMRRLESAFAAKSLTVFAVIDHSGEAAKVGLKIRPTKVLIFGSPKGGTPLMVASPSLAIDLPLKALVARGPT